MLDMGRYTFRWFVRRWLCCWGVCCSTKDIRFRASLCRVWFRGRGTRCWVHRRGMYPLLLILLFLFAALSLLCCCSASSFSFWMTYSQSYLIFMGIIYQAISGLVFIEYVVFAFYFSFLPSWCELFSCAYPELAVACYVASRELAEVGFPAVFLEILFHFQSVSWAVANWG